MIRALWAWLTGRPAPREPEQAIPYNPKHDPIVRELRLQRLQSERNLYHLKRHRNQVEEAYLPHLRKGRCHE